MSRALAVEILARMTRRKPADIAGHLSLGSLGLSSSFGLSALRSQLEARTGRRLTTFTLNLKVDELVALLEGATVASPTPPTASIASAPSTASAPAVVAQPVRAAPARTAAATGSAIAGALAGLGLGMDMQEVGVLPAADDPRAHPFYVGHFSPAELATAALRPDPRLHLCGIFCAKEAAKKSHPLLLPRRMLDFEVRHDAEGRPQLRVAGASGFEFLLSITHTAQFAAATCITHRSGA